MDQSTKMRVINCIQGLLALARQSVPFGAQKSDPTLREAEAVCEFLRREPNTPPSEDVVTFRGER